MHLYFYIVKIYTCTGGVKTCVGISCLGVVDESPETARALERAAQAALAALNMSGAGEGGEVERAAVEPFEPLALPARICQQVAGFHDHALYIILLGLDLPIKWFL